MHRWIPAVVLLAALGCEREPPNLTPYEQPELTFDAPDAGEYAEPGTFQAFGTFSNLVDLRVQGEAASTEGTTFQRQVELVRGANVIEARGTDLRGDQRWLRHGLLAGTWAPPIFEVEHASLVRINERGVDGMLDAMSNLLEPATLNDSVAAVNPVFQETYRLDTAEIATVTIAVTDIDFSALQITGQPKPDQASMLMSFSDLEIDADVLIEGLGNSGTVEVDIWADTADVTALITLKATEGKLDVTLLDTAVHFEEFGWDSSLIPGDVVGESTTQDLKVALEGALAEALNERIATTLEGYLSELDLSFESELLGTPFSAAATFANAGIDADGIFLMVDAQVEVSGDAGYSYPGYLVHEALDPIISREADISAAINDDFLNRVLFEAWNSGMLVQQLSTADESLSLGIAQTLGADSVTLTTVAKLAPVVVEREGQLQVQIAELEVNLIAPGSGFGDELSFAAAAWVDLTPQIVDGLLTLKIGKAETKVQVRGTSTIASAEALTTVLEDALPINLMLALVEDIAIPIPDFAGITVASATAERDAAGFHTHINIDID